MFHALGAREAAGAAVNGCATTVAPVLVVGIGNLLLRDDGVGVRVVERLAERPLPAHVETLDGGTAGADLLAWIADRTQVIFVDAVDFEAAPGSVAWLGPDDLTPAEGETISLHQVGLFESLWMAQHLGCTPRRTRILAIQPAEIGWGMQLSPAVDAAVAVAVEMLAGELPAAAPPLPQTHD